MKQRSIYHLREFRLAAIVLFCAFAAAGFFYPQMEEKTFGSNFAESTPTPRRRAKRTPAPRPSKPKYSEFSHATAAHKINCDACHKFPSSNWKEVRKGDDAFPDITDYPRHESCLSCHRQQFFSGNPPAICSICHTNPSPNNSARHAFPNPREIFDATPKGRAAAESDFAIAFPHDKHIEIVSENVNPADTGKGARFVNAGFRRAAGEESCAVCHKTYQPQGDSPDEYFTRPPAKLGDAFWLKKGTFKTVPTGHTQCFTCHSADTGIAPAPTDCATCHKLKGPEPKSDFDPRVAAPMMITDKLVLHAWRRRDSSATFRHEFTSHAEMECATCHDAAAMNTLDPLTKKVKVGSCAPCHITATADDGGILNFEVDARKKNAKFQCVKCHLAFGAGPVPESHLKTIAEQ
jgi:hypothetical protein